VYSNNRRGSRLIDFASLYFAHSHTVKLATEGDNQKFKFTEGFIYYFMGDREGACLSWLLFLFFKMQNRHGNILFDLTDGFVLKKTH
jgi:hypothetical protein